MSEGLVLTKKRKRKPYRPPPQGDTGPDTAAQRRGTVVAERREAGVIYRQRHRIHSITTMLKRGHLSPRQAAAGMEINQKYEETQRSPEPAWTRVFVDSSPRPGDVSVAMLEAKREWIDIMAPVYRHERPIVMAVCCHGLSILPGFTKTPSRVPAYRATLQAALDRVANYLRLR